jgi:hypothetical protein
MQPTRSYGEIRCFLRISCISLGDSDGVRQQHWRKICGHDLTAEELTDIRDASNRGGSLGRSDRDSARVGKAVIPTI